MRRSIARAHPSQKARRMGHPQEQLLDSGSGIEEHSQECVKFHDILYTFLARSSLVRVCVPPAVHGRGPLVGEV